MEKSLGVESMKVQTNLRRNFQCVKEHEPNFFGILKNDIVNTTLYNLEGLTSWWKKHFQIYWNLTVVGIITAYTKLIFKPEIKSVETLGRDRQNYENIKIPAVRWNGNKAIPRSMCFGKSCSVTLGRVARRPAQRSNANDDVMQSTAHALTWRRAPRVASWPFRRLCPRSSACARPYNTAEHQLNNTAEQPLTAATSCHRPPLGSDVETWVACNLLSYSTAINPLSRSRFTCNYHFYYSQRNSYASIAKFFHVTFQYHHFDCQSYS